MIMRRSDHICLHGKTKSVKLNRSRSTSGATIVPVDECIANEVQMLNDAGVITYGCCCGHGKSDPSCLVDKESESILKSIGYKLYEYTSHHSENGIYEILLKTGVNLYAN